MSNPKSFYNKPDYRDGVSSSSVVHKPDDASADGPPPPYSPGRQSSNASSGYGTLQAPQQRGLLGSSEPFSKSDSTSTKKSPLTSNPHIPSDWNPGSSSQSIEQQHQQQQHQQQQHQNIPITTSDWARNRIDNGGDPGCCRKWCKYLFIAILIWLVLLQYSDKLGLTPPDTGDGSSNATVCNGMTTIAWQDLPSTIEFSRNFELEVIGHVSGGRVVVLPLDDRHDGRVNSEVQFTPSDLDQDMRYEIQKQEKRDTTKLVLTMPPPRPDRTCVQLDIEIQLPYSADYLSINVQNVDLSVFPFVKDVDEVILNNSNGNVFIERWTGETLNVRNENGLIKVGQLSAGESIHIRNSNGPLQLQSDIYSKHDLDIINTNGEIGGVGRLGADDRISVETSNGVISLDELNSDNIYVTSSNGDILLRRVAADARAILRTSEGLIDASIIGSKNNVVVAQTSVGDVSLHVTHEFEGHFSFSSSNGRVDVPRDEGIDYDVKTDSDKKGNRLKGKGDMSVSTSSGDVQVVFDL